MIWGFGPEALHQSFLQQLHLKLHSALLAKNIGLLPRKLKAIESGLIGGIDEECRWYHISY